MGKSLWTGGVDGNSRKLLLIVLEQQEKGKSKIDWPLVAKIFNAQTKLVVTSKQASNHHSELKKQFKAWEELQEMTGIAYYPVTKAVDVEECKSERWKAFLEFYPRFSESLAKNGLENVDLLQPIFHGKSAQGVGSFSPAMEKGIAMGKGKVSLSKSIEDLTIADDNEGSGDSGDSGDVVPNDDDVVPNISFAESISPVKVVPVVASGSGSKRKSDTSLESYDSKRRQASFEDVIQMLAKAATPQNPPHPPPPPTKAELFVWNFS